MGNWRRVWLQLTIPQADLENLHDFINKHARLEVYKELNKEELYYNPDVANQPYENITVKWCELENFPNFNLGDELEALVDFVDIVVTPYFEYFYAWGNSVCGLNNWVNTNVDLRGNVGKDATNEAMMKEWRYIAAKFPSIKGDVHVCGDYENENCVGKISIANGMAIWKPPTVNKVSDDMARFETNFLKALILS